MGRTFRAVLFLGSVFGLMVSLHGQVRPESLAFDVASIKPSKQTDVPFGFRIEPDGTTAASGITLKRLLMTAYNVQGFRIVGAPTWVDSQQWDVQATHEGVASMEQIRQMLVMLLAERFQLRTHRDTRTLPVYELVVEPQNSKVLRTKDPSATPVVRVAQGSLQLTNVTSATFASQLSYAVARQ